MLKRKLKALKYHQVEKFNLTDESDFRNMVVWLEDQKIRHYRIEDRAKLRNIDDTEWQKTLNQYLNDMECPVVSSDKYTIMDWLISYAVKLEYGDNVDKYKIITADSIEAQKLDQPKVQSTNPLDNIDFQDPDFKEGITSLAKILQVPQHPDHLVTLKALSKLIKERLSPEAIASVKANVPDKESKDLPMDQCVLGFETGDYVMNEAGKILRLLHIRDLRELQTKINEAIVAAQAITANPKTDERLGKVGR